MYLYIAKGNYAAKILIGNTNQLFSLLKNYKQKGYTCKIA